MKGELKAFSKQYEKTRPLSIVKCSLCRSIPRPPLAPSHPLPGSPSTPAGVYRKSACGERRHRLLELAVLWLPLLVPVVGALRHVDVEAHEHGRVLVDLLDVVVLAALRPAGVPRSQYLRLQPLAARAFKCNGWLESFCFITLDMLQYRCVESKNCSRSSSRSSSRAA